MTLALDASTKSTGYAIFDNNKLIKYGCWQSSLDSVIDRIFYMVNEIQTILDNYKIEQIYIEEVLPKADAYNDNSLHHANPSVFKPLMWLQAAIVFLIHLKRYPTQIHFILPNSWRSRLGIPIGKGMKRESLKKADCAFVLKQFNITANDDVCDAIALGWSQVNPALQDFDWS